MCLLTSGIAQGSGLGPLLFFIYIDELAHILSHYHVTIKLYADDLKMYAEMCSDADATNLQSALSCVSDWAKKWLLTISIKKCCILHIRKVNADSVPVFSINDVALLLCNSVKEP